MSATTIRVGPQEGEEEPFVPGVYVTDGTRLFRVISPGRSLFPCAELEDCLTLQVQRFFSDELCAMRLHRVCSSVAR